VEDPARLDQQQFDLTLGTGLVLDSLRDDEHLACRNKNRTVAKIDPQNAVQDDERLVRVLVIMPDEVALQPDDLELVVVHFGDDLWLPLFVEQLELIAEIDGIVSHWIAPHFRPPGPTPTAPSTPFAPPPRGSRTSPTRSPPRPPAAVPARAS